MRAKTKIRKILANRPIKSVLQQMQVSQLERFPYTQMDSVRNAITRLNIYDRFDPHYKNRRFTTKLNEDIVEVTRIS
jgi:hypothetical protein